MSLVIAATIPSEVAARKLGEWLGKMVHRVQIVPRQGQWAIVVPEATLSRARRALREVIVAANPGNGTRECCKKLGKGAPCARCGRHAHFTVGWILPSRTSDERPACCAMCASALKRASANNPLTKMESKVLLTGALEHLQDHKRWQRMSPGTMLEEAGRAQGMASSVALYGSRRYRRVAKRVEGRGHRIGGSIRTRLAEVLPDSRSQPIMNPSIVLEWNQMTTKRREVLIRAAGFDPYAAENFSTRRWMQLPKIIQNRLMDSWESGTRRREAYATTRRMVRANPGRYLIQGLRPKHRNWVTLDYSDDEQRALLNALRRARLGDVAYRVWDTQLVREVWQGKGREAKIELWQTRRPSGLVGANRRKTMLRNPRISARMLPLRENTMRLGDAMKWGRRLLDAGVGIHLWDGSGWEVAIHPSDAYSTPSGRAASGGRRYLSQGAGLIKTWPITLLAPEMRPGFWLTPAAIAHYLKHQQLGVTSNPGCPSVLCNPWYYGYKKSGGVEKFFSRLKPTERSHGRRYGAVVGPFKKPKDMDKMYGFGWQAGPHTIRTRGRVRPAVNCGTKSNPRNERMNCLMNSPVETNARKAHEEIVSAFLAGRSKRIGARYTTDGHELRVWGNLVAHKTNGSIRLRDAGWRTLLTRNVLNTVLQKLGGGYSIYQKARQWYLSTPMGSIPWTGEWTVTARIAANPRIRAWNIVAITRGRGRETMQSGHKDKKKAHDIAKLYQKIAKKEGRRTRYAVEPFRYSDTASRMRSRRNSPEGWVVTQDGETLKTFGSSQHDANRAWTWLHHHQTKSVERAIREEGYDVVYVRNGKVGYSMKQDFLSKKNPLTRGESATLLRQAKMHVTTARHDRSAKKHGIASYAAGRAQGKASAVRQFGPRGARRAAWKVLDRAARTNPHAGLNGLMNNCDAKKAMTFA